jgi:hypothetical protein
MAEDNLGETHSSRVVIEVSTSGGNPVTRYQEQLHDSSQAGLDRQISDLQKRVDRSYDAPVSVEVKETHRSSRTAEQQRAYDRRDAADTERQISGWML